MPMIFYLIIVALFAWKHDSGEERSGILTAEERRQGMFRVPRTKAQEMLFFIVQVKKLSTFIHNATKNNY